MTFDLVSDLLNTFRAFIIVISLLITYKILTLTEPDLYRFLHIMRDAFANKAKSREKVEDYRNVDDVEAVGCIAGEVAEVVIKGLAYPSFL